MILRYLAFTNVYQIPVSGDGRVYLQNDMYLSTASY